LTAVLITPVISVKIGQCSCALEINLLYSRHNIKVVVEVFGEWSRDYEFTKGCRMVPQLYHSSTRGSHHKMEKEGFRSVPIPVHGSRDLGIGLIKAI
jgi:hypothetical protein